MLMRILKYGLLGIVLVVVVVGALLAAGVLGVPEAGLQDNSWGTVDDERIEVVTTFWIDNPNPGVPLGVENVAYTLAMNDIRLAEGETGEVTVPSGNTTQTIRTDIHYPQVAQWWVTHIQNGEESEMTVEAQANVSAGPISESPSFGREQTVETDLERVIEESMAEMEGEHSLSPVSVGDGTASETVEPTVEIEDVSAEWGAVDDERTELYLTFAVHNPNAYPLPTPGLTGEFVFNNITVAAWDANEIELRDAAYDTTIPPQGTREITFVVEMDNDNVTRWFATHVDNEEFSDVEVAGQLAMNINGQTATVPPEEEAFRCDYEMTTAIFVDQNASVERQQCELLPWAAPESLEDIGATVDLTDTEWWDSIIDGDGVLDGNETDGSDDGLTDDSETTDDSDGSTTDGSGDDSTDDGIIDGSGGDDGIVDDGSDGVVG